jgi:hypothetical protein
MPKSNLRHTDFMYLDGKLKVLKKYSSSSFGRGLLKTQKYIFLLSNVGKYVTLLIGFTI